MTINTKYYIGDRVYSITDNKVLNEYITGILTDTYKDDKGNIVTEIRYKTNNTRVLKQDKVFKSKEDLLNSL